MNDRRCVHCRRVEREGSSPFCRRCHAALSSPDRHSLQLGPHGLRTRAARRQQEGKRDDS